MSIEYNSPHCGPTTLLMETAEPEYIYSLLPEEGTLVEWGCGGSTVFFLDNLKENQYLISIEHNDKWFEDMSEKLKDHPNIDRHVFLYIPPEIPNPYYARPEEEMACGLEDYINFDMDTIKTADVFLIDGIARGPTAAFLSNHVKDSAQVLIHDYKGRELWYHWAALCFKHSVVPEECILLHMSNSEI